VGSYNFILKRLFLLLLIAVSGRCPHLPVANTPASCEQLSGTKLGTKFRAPTGYNMSGFFSGGRRIRNADLLDILRVAWMASLRAVETTRVSTYRISVPEIEHILDFLNDFKSL
jgi:hypothetical protein